MKRFTEGEERWQVTLLPDCVDDYLSEEDSASVIETLVTRWTSPRWASKVDLLRKSGELLWIRPLASRT
jgi:hypothetical protein